MTGPSPDDDLDNALGLNQLPPAAITDDHRRRARAARHELHEAARTKPSAGTEHRELTVLEQLIADAEQRGAARIIAEHEAAGTSPNHHPHTTHPTTQPTHDTRYRITDTTGTYGTVIVHPDEVVNVLTDWYPNAHGDTNDALQDLADALFDGKPHDQPAEFLNVHVDIAD